MSPARRFDDAFIQRLERHETICHVMPGREMLDLGDGLALFDPVDREPFFNRLSGPRWPDDAAAFDRRLAEILALFAIRDRQPHVWPSLGSSQPPDLVTRLEVNGFRDIGGGHLMVLDDPAACLPLTQDEVPAGTTITTMTAGSPGGAGDLEAVAAVSIAAFDNPDEPALGQNLGARPSPPDPGRVLALARVEGVPAAVAKTRTFDGLTYISTVGTVARFRGRGLAGLATRAAIAAAGGPAAGLPYLGVLAANGSALTLYRRLGFVPVGEAPDLLLA